MVTCAITTSVLGCLVTSFLFFRYTWGWEASLIQKSLVYGLFLLIGCIPLLVSYQLGSVLGSFYAAYRYSLYFIFIGAIILFTITLLADILLWGVSLTPVATKIKISVSNIKVILISVALICTIYALYAGIKTPDIKTVTITSDKLQQEMKIVLLSDIHIHRVINPDKVKQIVERTNALNPDLILLDGDIIDDDVDKVADISTLLKALKAPQGVYFVTGNHEFYAGYQETVTELQKLGFRFLENSGVSAGEIYLAGIPDLFSGENYAKYSNLSQAFAEASPKQFKILMSHTPADFGSQNNFDLEVSGHTHGGQIFPFHLFAKLHNRYLAGLYKMGNGTQIYVTRGAGQWGPQMRFLAPAEITVIKLIPLEKEN